MDNISTTDFSIFQPWNFSLPLVENDIRFIFTNSVHVRGSKVDSIVQCDGAVFDGIMDCQCEIGFIVAAVAHWRNDKFGVALVSVLHH